MLLAVIFSFKTASDSRKGRDPADSENNSAGFSRISAKKPSGTGKRRSDCGDPGVCFLGCLGSGADPGAGYYYTIPEFTTPQIRAQSSPRFPDSPNLGSVLGSASPCSIENSWSICPDRGSGRTSDKIESGHL
jgi:hypothetical protein